MGVEEETITRAIIQKARGDWLELAEVDAAVVGAGPAGLTAARHLVKEGLKTVVF